MNGKWLSSDSRGNVEWPAENPGGRNVEAEGERRDAVINALGGTEGELLTVSSIVPGA